MSEQLDNYMESIRALDKLNEYEGYTQEDDDSVVNLKQIIKQNKYSLEKVKTMLDDLQAYYDARMKAESSVEYFRNVNVVLDDIKKIDYDKTAIRVFVPCGKNPDFIEMSWGKLYSLIIEELNRDSIYHQWMNEIKKVEELD